VTPRASLAAAVEEVARRDRDLARVIRIGGPITLRGHRDEAGHFAALAESILYQQLAGAAAAAIHRRFIALFDGSLTPEAVLAASEQSLRGAGLSRNKAASIRDLAAKVVDGTVPLEGIGRLADDDIVARLTQVRGIGRWTAEMFLIFRLRRLDVWPVDDYGVRNGWAIAHGLATIPAPRALQAEGERFRPYRSVAAWYCWEAVHLSRRGAFPTRDGRSSRR
jgi:DNA-3-methyladenine glycosylase II